MSKQLDAFDVGMSMHTALRKCCNDEDHTEALRKLIVLMTFPDWCNPWIVYCELVADRLGRLGASDAIKAARSALPDEFDERLRFAKERGSVAAERCEPAMLALWHSLQCLDDEDVKAMGEYL
jgi:hypothetical protein